MPGNDVCCVMAAIASRFFGILRSLLKQDQLEASPSSNG